MNTNNRNQLTFHEPHFKTASRYQGEPNTVLARLVVSLSGGLVKTQQQAERVMVVIIVVCLLTIGFMFFLGGDQPVLPDSRTYIPGTKFIDDSVN